MSDVNQNDFRGLDPLVTMAFCGRSMSKSYG